MRFFPALKNPQNWSNAAAFLLPALALCVPSGYSWGPAVLCLGALVFGVRRLCAGPLSRPDAVTCWLALLFCALAWMWYGLLALEPSELRRWDRPVKFFLALPCLWFVRRFAPHPACFVRGLVPGCMAGGCVALWQVYAQGLERANGFTNAIQWGNMAMLMALWLALHAVVFWRQRGWPWRCAVLVAVLLGVQASFLSASRGGWAALGVALPLLLWLAWHLYPRWRWRALAGAAAVLLLALWLSAPMLERRGHEAADEVQRYIQQGHAETSLGIRLEQYRLALELIGERPLAGWGMPGYMQEMHQRVDAGRYSEGIRQYHFIHNEWLDLWVKTGLAGVLLQLALYASVLLLFGRGLRTSAVAAAPAGDAACTGLVLRASGVLLVLCYGVFGLSQHFFVHNSGILFFVFPLMLLWGMLQKYR